MVRRVCFEGENECFVEWLGWDFEDGVRLCGGFGDWDGC